ncbi:MAG: MerR family transcriptional regulator [Chloroflexi bacterium]|nr:MerR family transcriptional regulator [Chloroflexota bacterium]
MHITELARLISATVDELRYMERKGFIESLRTQPKQRTVRDYGAADVKKAGLIIKYRRQGFTWDIAFKKAMEELAKPTLF